ncbi:MAG: hypothetical protein WCJ63_01685 [Actinomycetes bacterium]
MRRVSIFFAALAVAAVLAVPAFASTTKTVNWTFGVKTVSIKKNDTVKWSWSGSMIHNVKGPGVSTSTTKNGSASRKFTAKGTFTYICSVHGASAQKTTVKVS